MRIGVHVPLAKGLLKGLDYALKLNCNTLQFFIRNPRSWQMKKISPQERRNFVRLASIYEIKPLIAHACYIINLAAENKILRQKSFRCLIEDLKRAEELKLDFYVIHFGSHRKKQIGLKFFRNAIARALNKLVLKKLKILVENTAGEGNKIGADLDEIAYFLKGLSPSVSICFDTAHLFAAGYKINERKSFSYFLEEIAQKIGLERIKLIHLNDSFYPCGRKKDRHQDIAKGYIGEKGFQVILQEKFIQSLPLILETPKQTIEDDRRNIHRVKYLINKLGA